METYIPPEDKAKELYSKFYDELPEVLGNRKGIAKKCVELHALEMMKQPGTHIFYKHNHWENVIKESRKL